jgi:NADPH:quinone reductase-like Zn-dependent oxidoreductase
VEDIQDGGATGIASTMRAVRLHAPGGLGALVVEEAETPGLAAGEALVRVHAAALTRDELDWALDRLPAIPAYEFSGVVAAAAPDVTAVAVGQPVYALSSFGRNGAAAEYIALSATLLAPKPLALDHLLSAAVPLGALSAWQGLFEHGELRAGQRLLIHGAAGGVGQFATQLGRWCGAHVIGTTSQADAEIARSLGADEVIGYDSDLLEAVAPVDLVLDTVGGELLARSPELVRSGGRLVSVADEPPQVGTEAKIATVYFVVKPNREQLVEIGGLVESGHLLPAVDSTFPLTEARAAFARSMARGKRGKVVLRVFGVAGHEEAR